MVRKQQHRQQLLLVMKCIAVIYSIFRIGIQYNRQHYDYYDSLPKQMMMNHREENRSLETSLSMKWPVLVPFSWLFVDAFGLVPSSRTATAAVKKTPFKRRYNQHFSDGSTSIIWGSSKIRKQSLHQPPPSSSSFIVCKSTINGEAMTKEETVAPLLAGSVLPTESTNGQTAVMNGVTVNNNNDDESSSSNAALNGQVKVNGVNGAQQHGVVNGAQQHGVANGVVVEKMSSVVNNLNGGINNEVDNDGSLLSSSINGSNDGNDDDDDDPSKPLIPDAIDKINGAESSRNEESNQHSIDVNTEIKANNVNDNDNNNDMNIPDVPMPTAAGGFTHTSASRAKISAANKGKTPWNKGKSRSDEVRARIAEGVRRKNRERLLAKLQAEGITEEEYEQRKKEKRRKADAERRARKTEKGGYIPTEETKRKISRVLKEKYATGEIKRKPRDPSTIRKGFKHTDETKAKIAESLRRKWAEDSEYREYMTQRTIANDEVRNAPSVRERISETLKKKWEDPEFRESMMEKFKNRKSHQSSAKAAEHRQKISEAMKKKWMDEEYRKRATRGMVRQRDSAPPRMVKPIQPKGIVAKSKLDPLNRSVKKKAKKKKKKSSINSSSSTTTNASAAASPKKIDASPITPIEPMSAEAAREIPKEQSLAKEEELPEGSIERLRRDRKDLYDLLYGDDEEEEDIIEPPPDDIEDVSFTSMLLTGVPKGGSSSKPLNPRGAAAIKKKIESNRISKKPVFVNGDTGASKLASMLADDDDLDDFDPYGLDNF